MAARTRFEAARIWLTTVAIKYWTAVAAYIVVTGAFFAARTHDWISTSDLVTGLSVVAGTVPSVYTAVLQIRESRAENDRSRKANLRQDLEIRAFTDVTSAVTELSSRLASLGSCYSVANVTLLPPIPNPISVNSILMYTPTQLGILDAKSAFVIALEAHEIALLPFHHLRIFLQYRLDDLAAHVIRVGAAAKSEPPSAWAEEDNLARVRGLAAEVAASFHELQFYLMDYRIEIMNGLVGNLFPRRVPRRQPLQPGILTLVEVATPERVAAEGQRRLIEAVIAK